MNTTLPTISLFDNSPWIQNIFQNCQDAIIITDQAFNIVKWNSASERLCCRQFDSQHHMNMMDLLQQFSDHNALAVQKMQMLALTGLPEEDIIITCTEGNSLQLSCFTQKLPGIAGHSAYVFILRDLASKIRDTKGAHPVELLYRTMVDTLYEGVVLLEGKNGTVLYGNERAWEIIGFEEDRLIGADLTDVNCEIIHEDGTAFLLHELPPVRTLRTGITVENVVVGIKRPSGKISWLSVNASPLNNAGNSPVIAAVSFFDITYRKETEYKLMEREQIFRSFMNNTHSPAWITDEDGLMVYMNDLCKETWGLAGDSYLNKNMYDLFPNELADEFRANNQKVLDGTKPITTIEKGFRKDGTPAIYRVHKFLLQIPSDKQLIAGQSIDITDELQAQDEIRKSTERFAHAVIAAQDHERNELSKELHDNVNQLLSSASILLSSFNADDWDENVHQLDKGRRYIKLAIQEIRKMSKALNTSVINEVGLEDPIEDIANTMRISQNMEVIFEYDADLEDEMTNEHKLMVYRIVQEQSNNIIKYAAASEVTIAVRRADQAFTLSICDNGIGFDMAIPAKGIGLINIKNRVDSLNGKLDIISSPGNGCQIEIAVPM